MGHFWGITDEYSYDDEMRKKHLLGGKSGLVGCLQKSSRTAQRRSLVRSLARCAFWLAVSLVDDDYSDHRMELAVKSMCTACEVGQSFTSQPI